MRLAPDAKKVLRYAWSIRWMCAAIIFSVAEVVLPLFFYEIPRGIFASLTAVATAGGFVTRLLAQKEFDE